LRTQILSANIDRKNICGQKFFLIFFSSVENPCAIEENRCQHFCLNAGNGKAKCQCYPGFKLAEDQFSCVGKRKKIFLKKKKFYFKDINECIENESPLCSFNCENTYGNYYCVCPEGYQLGEDGYNCEPNRLGN